MKTILLFGAGKSATCLIDFLFAETSRQGWNFIVADRDVNLVKEKTGHAPHVQAVGIIVEDESARRELVAHADVVISLLPPTLHALIAKECLHFKKHLLTASYVDVQTKLMEKEIAENNLLFLCEMGLDPGIDHMSAMELISKIKSAGAHISSFRSHTGGLVAPESDDNPWHYKISWNPRNVVLAGASGAIYKKDGLIVEKKYAELFSSCEEVDVPNAGRFAFYPNRDSLSYIPVYGLPMAATFIRTTLRYPIFCRAWNALVKAGLTNDNVAIDTASLNFKRWSAPALPFIEPSLHDLYVFLGLFSEEPIPVHCKTSADVLQFLIEKNLAMQPNDKDMIVMAHELEYTSDGKEIKHCSSLVVVGEDSRRTAMAKTVGLPLGIAATLLLQEKINVRGLHIPIVPEIYEPVLSALAKQGIEFEETIS